MTGSDKEGELYDRYLESAIAERASLKQAEQTALHRYMEARKAYRDYRPGRVE